MMYIFIVSNILKVFAIVLLFPKEPTFAMQFFVKLMIRLLKSICNIYNNNNNILKLSTK